MEGKKKRKIRALPIIFICLIVMSISAAGFCGFKYFSAKSQYAGAEALYGSVADEYVTVKSIDVDTNAGADEDEAEKVVSPIEVDFEELSAQCGRGEAVGWLYCEGTVINYPVVRCEDNEYYLDHLINGTPNACGTLFVDCKNSGDFTDTNTIIYGHHMADGQMFNCLKLYRMQEDYYAEHPVMYLNTPNGNYELQIVSTFITDTQSMAFKTSFANSDEIDSFISFITGQSLIDTDVEVNSESRFVTLATCSYEFNNARTVVCGVLNPIG